MAKTGVENRIMGDLNAYSPEVSGEFPASPYSPKQLDITLEWFKLLWALCSLGHSWQRTLALETRVRTLVLVATREVNARAGGDERVGQSCWQRGPMLALATRAVECLCWQRTLALATRAVDSCASGVLATDACAGDKSGGCLCRRRRTRWTLVLVATREVDGGCACWW